MTPLGERSLRNCSVALLILAAFASAAIFSDYGVTWDEGHQSTYGELVLDYFASAGRDLSATEYSNLFYYGPLFESLAAAAYRVAGSWKYEVRHAAIGLTALLTLVAVWRFARSREFHAVGLFAVLALAAMPRFVGHAFNNSKDVPFACAFAWAMVGISALLSRRRWDWRDVLFCGAGIGLALSVRVGAVLLLALFACGVAASAWLDPDERRAWRQRGLDRATKTGALVLVAWTIMVLAWPWAHGNPITHPLKALGEMSSFTFAYPIYFAGEFVQSDQLPRYYLPWYLAIVTPLAVQLLALLGAGLTLREVACRGKRALPAVLALSWFALPLAYVVVTRPNVYDGIRHFLFILPALALLAGWGASWLLDRVRGNPRWLAAGGLVLVLVVPLRDVVQLHPYQSSYFNALAGGVGNAWRSYDTDYWASSYREAVRWVLDRTEEEGPVIVACNDHNRPCAEYYLDAAAERDPGAPRLTLHCVWKGDEALPDGARYYVGMLRYGKAAAFFPDWPVVHRVGRSGATFSVVKRNPAPH